MIQWVLLKGVTRYPAMFAANRLFRVCCYIGIAFMITIITQAHRARQDMPSHRMQISLTHTE
jgi:hypothetical protein